MCILALDKANIRTIDKLEIMLNLKALLNPETYESDLMMLQLNKQRKNK